MVQNKLSKGLVDLIYRIGWARKKYERANPSETVLAASSPPSFKMQVDLLVIFSECKKLEGDVASSYVDWRATQQCGIITANTPQIKAWWATRCM